MDKKEVNMMRSAKLDDNLNLINNLNDSVAKMNGMSTSDLRFTNSNDLDLNMMTTQTGWHSDQSQKTLSCWGYWRDYYYPTVIRDSYPVYIQERAQDKGKQAFEIIKMLKDKRFLKLEAVGDFIDVMDELIKIL